MAEQSETGQELGGAGQDALWVLVARARVDAGLRDLPVVGPYVPREVDVRLRGLQVALSRRNLTPQEVTRINGLLTGVRDPTSSLALPDGEMKGTVQLAVAVELGGRPLVLGAPAGARPKPQRDAQVVLAAGGDTPVVGGDQRGTAWHPVGRGLGPVHVERLGVRYADNTVWLLVDAGLRVQGLTLSGRGMGLGINLDDPSRVSGTLEGLGLSWSKPPVEIAGALIAKSDKDYVVLLQGMATVRTPALELGAVGSYAQRRGQPPSVFVFGRLAFASGQGIGPPPFRITGAAAGFGYNSAVRVPKLTEVEQFPLMPGGDQTPDPLVMLDKLTGKGPGKQPWITESRDHLWLAAGVEFDSFNFVHGRILGLAQFSTSGSQEFSAMLLGRAWAVFPRVGQLKYAHVDVALAATYESRDDALKVFAALVPGSFVLHPSCRLSGQAAFCAWFGRSAHPGDFVLSLGGYHPKYKPPTHYPRPQRLALDWSVSDQVSLHGSCYGALTPSAFMVGAQLEVSFHAGPIKAWCRAVLDAFVQWDPFAFALSVKVEVGVSIDIWPYFHGSLGVSLEAWGPPTGGIASVHVLAWDFDIRFGEDRPAAPKQLKWREFADSVLPKPAVDARPVAGTLPGPAGDKLPADGPWIASRQGFGFATSSVLPVQKVRLGSKAGAPPAKLPDGNAVDIRPVGARGVSSTHRVVLTWRQTEIDPVSEGWRVVPENGRVPLGLWGEPLPADKQPPVPRAGKDLVPARTGLRFEAPDAQLADSAVATTQQRLGRERVVGPPVPLAAPFPVAHSPLRPGNVREDLEDNGTDPERDVARLKLLTDLAGFGVVPYEDVLPWAMPFPQYCADVRAHLRTEPMRQAPEDPT